MTVNPNTARKAGVLVPLAVLSAGWTAMLASAGADAAAGQGTGSAATPPAEAIEAPATVGQVGIIAPAAPALATPRRVSTVSADAIPAAALAAYQRAAQVIGSADPGCHLSWSLIAAIGRVESDHGRFGGSVLSGDGVATPGIFGVPLDGSRGTARVPDSDAGMYDGDAALDRAVGPMQFIPSTWQVVGVDGDGDSQRNPQDVDDAALATAVHLCSGSGDLSTVSGVSEAVYRYNHSSDYVALVSSIADRYEAGTFNAVATRTYGVTTFSPAYAGAGKAAAGVKAIGPADGTGAANTSATEPAKSKPVPPKPAEEPASAANPNAGSKPHGSLADLVEQVPAQLESVVDGGSATVDGILGMVGGLAGSLIGNP